DEGEGAVGVGGDDHRDRKTRLHLLRGGVERLAELHDVQAALTQRGTDRRRGVGLAGLHLQLDVTEYFLCHFSSLRVLAPFRLPIAPGGNVPRLHVAQTRVRPSRPGRTPAPPGWTGRRSTPPRAGGSFRS